MHLFYSHLGCEITGTQINCQNQGCCAYLRRPQLQVVLCPQEGPTEVACQVVNREGFSVSFDLVQIIYSLKSLQEGDRARELQVEVEHPDDLLFQFYQVLLFDVYFPLLTYKAYHPVVGRLNRLLQFRSHKRADYR